MFPNRFLEWKSSASHFKTDSVESYLACMFLFIFFTQRALYKPNNIVALSPGETFALNHPIKLAATYIYVKSFKSKCCFALLVGIIVKNVAKILP